MRTKIKLAQAQRLSDEGYNAPAIAEQMGVSRQGIYYLVRAGKLRCDIGPWGGRARRVAIDPERLRQMVADNLSSRQIAEAFGCKALTIIRACRVNAIPLPVQRDRFGQIRVPVFPVAKPPATPQPPAPTDMAPRTASLIATGGRYGDLAAWAAEWGVSATQARLEWHRLRLPVAKGARI